MSNWAGSTRRERLPADWQALRAKVHRRDGSKCQVRLSSGAICGEVAVDVDHIRAGDDHSLSNLRCICDWHHKEKSSREGGQAYYAKLKRSRAKFRRVEAHPGML